MGYILGLDLGTSSLKGLVIDKSGNLIASAVSDYPLISPQAGYSEQEPDLWLKAAESVIFKLIENVPNITENLEGISFSGQMHSLVLLDENNEVVRNAILWNDVRTSDECREITEKLGDDLLSITKNKALEGFTLPKILWVQKHEPENWKKTRSFLLPKDYLRLWLTGNKNMDYSDAAGTLMLDMENFQWSSKILQKFSIPSSMAPDLVHSIKQTGTVLPALSRKFGFKQEVRVFAGGADNACAAIGASILDEDTALASIGTSGVFLSYEDNIKGTYGGHLHFFSHAITEKAYSMGVTLSAGNSLSWYRKTFAPNESYDTLLENIKNIEPGSNGLMFAPYIMGERTPHTDAKVRGSFTGIDVSHTRDHFSRAVLEGITFSLKDCQNIMKEKAGKTAKTIISVGGGAKNPLWLQIQADIFGATVLTLEKEEGPAMGAIMIGAVGLGWFSDFTDCAKVFVKYKDRYDPSDSAVLLYEKLYEKYKRIYPAIKTI